MGEKTPQEPEVDVVEAKHDASMYRRMGEDKRDTTDDGWGNGVFAGHEDAPGLPAPGRNKGPADNTPDLRRVASIDRDEVDDEDEDGPNLLVVFAMSAGGAAIVLGVGYVALSAMGVV